MSKIDATELVYRIVNRATNPPDNITSTPETMGWLNGYGTCQNDILNIIDKMRDEEEGK